jgi:hypothetical protein
MLHSEFDGKQKELKPQQESKLIYIFLRVEPFEKKSL